MKQTILITLFCFAAGAMILVPTLTEAKCNTCNANGIACINETAFNLCFSYKPDTTNKYNCPNDTICSQTHFKCVSKDSGVPACDSTQGCGQCDGIKMFACTSRTTFAQCNGHVLTKNSGKCPEGYICNSNSAEICVNECNMPDKIECDRDAPL